MKCPLSFDHPHLNPLPSEGEETMFLARGPGPKEGLPYDFERVVGLPAVAAFVACLCPELIGTNKSLAEAKCFLESRRMPGDLRLIIDSPDQ